MKALQYRTIRVRKSIKRSPHHRMIITRSNRGVSVQVIAPDGNVLASARERFTANRLAQSRALGEKIGKTVLSKKIERVVLDRGGYAYHGHVKEIADGARSVGLQV